MITNEKLIAVLGPTASGKTGLAIKLALRLNGEIISGDSMLVFKKFNIGTAKPTAKERQGIAHHLINICEPDADYSVAQFQLQARKLIKNLNQSGKLPILCGGTGLYAKAVLENYAFSEQQADLITRKRLNETFTLSGIEPLRAELLNLNSGAFDQIDYNNPRRIIRAIETLRTTGKLPSASKDSNCCYRAAVLAVDYPRAQLYQRINDRVDTMIADGLFEEVADLLKQLKPDCQAMQGIGYKEVVECLQNKTDKSTAIEKIKTNTRRFAKRQLTWYKKMPYINWISPDILSNEALFNELVRSISNKLEAIDAGNSN